MLRRHTDPDILLMKCMKALMKATEEPLYDEFNVTSLMLRTLKLDHVIISIAKHIC